MQAGLVRWGVILTTKKEGVFMRILRTVLLIVLSFSSFALDTHFESEEEIKFADEMFTQKEKEWSNIWTFDFAQNVNHVDDFTNFNDTKISHVFKIPHFKFYKSPDLSGEVFAQIDDKGLRVGDKYICFVEKVDEKNYTLTQNQHWDSKEVGNTYEIRDPVHDGAVLKYLISCKDFFIYPIPTGGEQHYFHPGMKFEVINNKIGKIKMRGVDVYFDATPWISTYSAKTDALTTLKKILAQDDFDQIYELIKKLRKLIEAEDKEGIYTLVTGKKIEDINKVGAYGVININSYFLISKEELLSYKFNKTKKNNLLKATTFRFKRVGVTKYNTSLMSVSVYGLNVSNLKYQKYNGVWKIQKIYLR